MLPLLNPDFLHEHKETRLIEPEDKIRLMREKMANYDELNPVFKIDDLQIPQPSVKTHYKATLKPEFLPK
jgi:hypothetical protein